MKRTEITAILLILAIFATNIHFHSLNAEEKKIHVVATLEVYSSIAEFIGDGLIETDYILPEGTDPHDYSLTPGDVDKISSADLLVLANSEFFSLESKMLEHYSGAYLDFSDYSKYNLTIISIPGIGVNYHGYWIYPSNALAIAKAIHDELVLLDPDNREIYDANLKKFEDMIYRLESFLYRTSLENNLNGQGAVIAVPGAAYLALAFNLKIEASLLKGPGSFLNSSELSEVINKAKKGEIKVIICPISLKDGKPGELSRQLSQDTGVPVVYVRVFSMYGLSDYFALMTFNAGVLSNANKIGATSSGNDLLIWYLLSIGVLFVAFIVESAVIFIYKRRAENAWIEQ